MTEIACDHKCHEEPGLNPWVKMCPVCGCPNAKYDPEAKPPQWLKDAYDSILSGTLEGLGIFFGEIDDIPKGGKKK
jgi:hypothetical protein